MKIEKEETRAHWKRAISSLSRDRMLEAPQVRSARSDWTKSRKSESQ